MPITILLVDQHPVIREGLKAVFGQHEDVQIIGETGEGLAAIKLVDILAPDVLIVGVMLPGLHGLEVIRQVRQRAPRTRVVMLSRYANATYVLEALSSGAAGYVLQSASVSELVQAVRDVAAGQCYLSAALAAQVSEMQQQGAKREGREAYELLTPREREVLRLTAAGQTNAEMAAALGISARTVETHRAHLRQKLGLRTQADLIRYALQRGILLPEP